LSANFGDTDPSGEGGDYKATVDWGDGHSTTGTVTSDGNGGFNVQATSNYTFAGSYQALLAGSDPGTSVSITAPGTITDAPLTVVGAPTIATQASTGIVARFTDAGGILPKDKYAVLINWGDGSVPSPGMVTISGTTILCVGSHTYAAPGSYQVGLTLNDLGGNSAATGVMVFIGTPTQVYVERTFLDLLGRSVKLAGLNSWTNLLNQQIITPRQFVSALLSSQEYRTLFVQHVYDKYLRRPVGTGGLNTQLTLLANGSTPEQIQANILASDEYFAKEGGGTVDEFLGAIYQDGLGRPINPSDLAAREADG